ncbi:TMEM43 family protein [Rugamonas aquatica]|nr:TMEM43 family protein [Rugamonas aquatica]
MKTWLLRAAGAVLLALVFMAYLTPDFMLDLANRIYLCF